MSAPRQYHRITYLLEKIIENPGVKVELMVDGGMERVNESKIFVLTTVRRGPLGRFFASFGSGQKEDPLAECAGILNLAGMQHRYGYEKSEELENRRKSLDASVAAVSHKQRTTSSYADLLQKRERLEGINSRLTIPIFNTDPPTASRLVSLWDHAVARRSDWLRVERLLDVRDSVGMMGQATQLINAYKSRHIDLELSMNVAMRNPNSTKYVLVRANDGEGKHIVESLKDELLKERVSPLKLVYGEQQALYDMRDVVKEWLSKNSGDSPESEKEAEQLRLMQTSNVLVNRILEKDVWLSLPPLPAIALPIGLFEPLTPKPESTDDFKKLDSAMIISDLYEHIRLRSPEVERIEWEPTTTAKTELVPEHLLHGRYRPKSAAYKPRPSDDSVRRLEPRR